MSARQRIAHGIAVSGIAGIWGYHGIVPKMVFADESEWRPMLQYGLVEEEARVFVRLMGLAELAFAFSTVKNSGKRWPFAANLVAMPALAAVIWKSDRRLFGKAFNPATLNLSVMALSAIALATRKPTHPLSTRISGMRNAT